MPYRRTYRRRRTTRRPMRRMRRRIRTRRPSLKSLKVHHFKRTVALSQISSSNTGLVAGGLTFNLGQLPNSTEFTSLYDMYRINKIAIKFVPAYNSSSVGTTAEYAPNFHSVIDATDATAPTTTSELFQYGNHRMTRGTQVHTRVFTPASLDFVNATAGSTAGNPTWKQWLSTSASTVEHYALKYAVEQGFTNNAITWSPYATFYFSCKAVK